MINISNILFSAQNAITEAETDAADAVTTAVSEALNTTTETESPIPGLPLVIYRIISIIIVIAIAIVILLILRKLFRKYFTDSGTDGDKINKERVTIARISYSVLRYLVIALAIISILSVLGVNITAAIAGLGIVGAIGALSVQDLLKDLITGANIASEQYFAIGDCIEFDKYKGMVTGLSMRSTKLLTFDGSEVTIQNHLINEVRKISRENKIILPLSYELNRDEAYALCKRLTVIISAVPNVDSCKTSGIQEFTESSVNFAFLFYCSPEKVPSTTRAINVAIINELDRSGVKIPYAQLKIITEVTHDNSPDLMSKGV